MTRKTLKKISLLALLLTSLNCTTTAPVSAPTQDPPPLESVRNVILGLKTQATEGQRLSTLFEAYWKYSMSHYPELATQTGYPGQNGQWSDLSFESIRKIKSETPLWLQALQGIDPSQLNSKDQLSYALFKQEIQDSILQNSYPNELFQISQMGGIHIDTPSLLLQAPRSSVKDYEDRIQRLEKLPTLIHQTTALLKKGMKLKVTPPQIAIRDIPRQVAQLYETPWDKNPLFASFESLPSSFSAEEKNRLRESAQQILQSKVFPAFKSFHEFLVSRYLPACRHEISWSSLPQGKAWYAQWVKHHTTTPLTPRQIHQLGLSEVKRIQGEMAKISQKLGFKSIKKFEQHLKSDSKFVHHKKSEFIAEFESYKSELEPQLDLLFKRTPSLDCEIKPVPAFAEKSAPAAYMEPGSIEQSRPSVFFANTYDLSVIPKWRMRTLFLHEAIPGHHFQLVLAQENSDLPEFRKQAHYTAFTEGWALYAESLGYELNFFKDPYSEFGHLSDEILRAVRLVVDTGMHALGWSRQRAIRYFVEATLHPEHEAITEIDRYLVLPGQALAYKLGQLKLQSLREDSQKQLGKRFDIREFHDVFLKNGTLPLNVLDQLVQTWKASTK